jgi:hypothetical protein
MVEHAATLMAAAHSVILMVEIQQTVDVVVVVIQWVVLALENPRWLVPLLAVKKKRRKVEQTVAGLDVLLAVKKRGKVEQMAVGSDALLAVKKRGKVEQTVVDLDASSMMEIHWGDLLLEI